MWVYPATRIFAIVPIALLEDHITGQTEKKLLDIAKYLHGGAVMSQFMMTLYPVLFACSLVAYIYWYARMKKRITWPHRIALVFVTLLTIANVPLLMAIQKSTAIDAEQDDDDAPLQLLPPLPPPPPNAENLFLNR